MLAKRVLAFDLGASSGRAMLGQVEHGRISLNEIHRFANEPITIGSTLHWDFDRLFSEIKAAMKIARDHGGFDAISIDTWGVDFGLIGSDGNLLELPVHYRDERTVGIPEKLFELIDKKQLYMQSGIQIMRINTIFQLYSLKLNRNEFLSSAKSLLMVPDLFAYMLTGAIRSEYTEATTTGLINPDTHDWNWDLIDLIGINKNIFPPIIHSGESYGLLSKDICDELKIPQVPVIAVGCHDTASAIAAVPAKDDDFIYVSCGTWSLFGTLSKTPFINDKSYQYNLTNEGGIDKETTFLKNIMGLWLIQESRRQFKREGSDLSYAELEQLALEAQPFKCFINPNHESFESPGDLPSRIREFCKDTNQPIPTTIGEVMRCIYESIALEYANSLMQISNVTSKKYDAIHIIGGGTKDEFLCQLAADACRIKVVAGPIEATAIGNISTALIALGEISDKSQARQMIRDNENVKTFIPQDSLDWERAFDEYISVINS
ncbi:MAG: rhamnulokinase [Clostridiales bacterium]|nr:rhamnulokinase [Clostridiales bacterium]